MGKIIFLMGKSSTGKDTVFKELLRDDRLGLRAVVPYTTRPIRAGETEGVEYHFTDEDTFLRLQGEGHVIEDRVYHTVRGPWRYFTADDGQIDRENGNYIMIGTLESYRKLRDYFGAECMLPVLIELDDGARLQRALNRERKQEHPGYEEMCRRFLADSEDFGEAKIAEAAIDRRFVNHDLWQCLKEIRTYLEQNGVGQERLPNG